jgi:hypothetical protein
MTKYSDIPIPANACHYRTTTHTLPDGTKSRSYCRKLTENGSEFCPRHLFLMAQKERERIEREEAEKEQPVLNV